MTDAQEVWKTVEGWPYEVSDFGRVRRSALSKYCSWKSGDCLAPRRQKNGYLSVQMSDCGRLLGRTIHSLVCEAFHGPKPTELHQVAHFDGNRANNRADNLRWATAVENRSDDYRNGTRHVGDDTPQAVITTAEALYILRSKERGCDLAKRFNMAQSSISNIRTRRVWKRLVP